MIYITLVNIIYAHALRADMKKLIHQFIMCTKK